MTATAKVTAVQLQLFNRPTALKDIFLDDVSLLNYLKFRLNRNIITSDLLKTFMMKQPKRTQFKTVLGQQHISDLYQLADSDNNQLSLNTLVKNNSGLLHHTIRNGARIFDGALMGVILLQYVYDIDLGSSGCTCR